MGIALAIKSGGSEHVLAVSGRASFQLVQKAVMAGIPVLAAVGAPSSLAVSAAVRDDVDWVLRDDRFNLYAGWSRLQAASLD